MTAPPTPPIPALTCGVDEAGRGPLAGSVFAAAVVLDPRRPIEGLADSKQLTAAVRESLCALIRRNALAWSIASATVAEIDRLDILRATMLAMTRAVEALGITPSEVCVDGNRRPPVKYPCRAIVGGDRLLPEISAASILAKVARDAEMLAMEERYPGYGFALHKGYGTPEHLAALKALGPCDIHRRTFEPVVALLQCDLPF
ncbi:MAG TPA: ribonuclease HII [Usitatibacter sp.]|nr:ribonuclease HII [Usitatibacter sp.]